MRERRPLYWTPVVDVIDLPEFLVRPGSSHGEDVTVWWVANDPETATACVIHEGLGGVGIEAKWDR